jgi:hypothetical protein
MPLPAVIHCTSPVPSFPLVSQAVAVVDRPRQHVSDGLDAPVRVPGEPGAVVSRIIVAEVVEQQEGVELARVAEAEGPAKLDLTPAPSIVGLDSKTGLTGRMELVAQTLLVPCSIHASMKGCIVQAQFLGHLFEGVSWRP